MAKRAILTTVDYLINATLPEPTETYTVISHGFVINKIKELLEAKGFQIQRELYRCNEGAFIAQGVYHLISEKDPDMSMMFAWSNSYDKSLRFRCSVGAYVHSSLASIIGGNMAKWGRKHTGTADEDTSVMIESQIDNADNFFNQLIADKEAMKEIKLTKEEAAAFVGKLYFLEEILTGEQMNIIKDEMNKPSFDYKGDDDSLWSLYNAIVYSLQKSHPKTWMEQQSLIHWMVCSQYKIDNEHLANPVVNEVTDEEIITDPNQLDLIDVIEEVESENTAEEIIEEEEEESNDELTVEETSVSNELDELNDEYEFLADQAMIKEEDPSMSFLPEEELTDEVEVEEVTVSEQVMTESELNHELHGVNNDNVEASFPVIDEIAEEEEEDMSWPCLECGTVQGPNDIFHDGQICSVCHSKK